MAWGSVNVPSGSTQGADGKSAYQIAVENGFSGTEAQWLASLKGDKGETGADGRKGDTGDAGQTGPAGPGLPAGGTAKQVPVKIDGTNYNVQWKTLTARDVGAASDTNAYIKNELRVSGKLEAYSLLATSSSPRPGGTGSIILGNNTLIISASHLATVDSIDKSNNTCTVTAATSYFFTDPTSNLSVENSEDFILITQIPTSDNPNAKFTYSKLPVVGINKNNKTVTFASNRTLPDNIKYIGRIDSGNGSYSNKGCMVGGDNSIATGLGSIAYGRNVVAVTDGIGTDSDVHPIIALGEGLVSYTDNQTIFGLYNNISNNTSDLLIVGSGYSSGRSNCLRVTRTGVYANGNYNSTGADYAEQFEWQDSNPNDEDRIGRFVTLNGDRICLASSNNDFILGIISGNPSVIGDTYDDQWQGMYITDIFGRWTYEDVTIPAEYDDEGNMISEEHVETRLAINPNYDNTQTYIPRSQRKEWAVVGMMGKLVLIDDGTCEVNGWAKPSDGGIGTKSDTPTKFRVMARLDETHVRVLIL